MRLFFYYALHSFKNQLKKLFKSWFLIFFLVCFLVGGGIGAGIAALEDAAEPSEETAAELEEALPEDDESAEEDASKPSAVELLGLTTTGVIEFFAGLVILIVYVVEILGADRNGSKIFLPADVPLLFAAPMKPTSVLMFRLMTQLGLALLASIYMVFQLPNLILNAGLSLWQGLAIMAAYALTIISGKLIQVLLYAVCSTHPQWKPMIRRGVYVLLILIAGGLILHLHTGSFLQQGIRGIVTGSVEAFSVPWTRFIPLWGWIKGFLGSACSSDLSGSMIYLGVTILGIVALIYLIGHVKADFYEDAMAQSEETAELLAKAQQEGGLYVSRRKKDRSDKLLRDGLSKGSGANIFFHKTMYNRRRFAHLGFFTKTSETYLIAAILISLFLRFALDTRTILPVVLTMAGVAFFRSLGNPLDQDTRQSYFILIPEKTGWKLFWALLGGCTNCLLDALIGMIPAILILQANPLEALVWLPVIVSVDLFATIVGTFIDLSIPIHTGKTIKQLVQILFIYFGLLPDIIVIVICLALLHSTTAAVLGTLIINVGLGAIFFFLSVLAIDHCFGK
ncbi:MAG: putative ABC exporter domain-containing protein [Firmicutes bacterium]|nr:putative ABC exporter domain-containing protein [Bacillota bacterium]